MSKSPALPPAICSRPLTAEANRGPVFAEIGAPEQAGPDEWRCPFWIRGVDATPRYAVGADGLQALALAIAGLRAALEGRGKRYTWKGGDSGDHGIPPIVPTSFGREFCNRVEQFIESEIASLPGRP